MYIIDAQECPVASDFRCNNTGACVRQEQICDGIIHCSDESDETNCSKSENNMHM